MFETANDRGTPSPLDLFRAYCIKRARIGFRTDESELKSIQRDLDQVERQIHKAAKGKPEDIVKQTKSLMSAWMSCRTGQLSDKGFSSMIASLVNSCQTLGELENIIEDLTDHSTYGHNTYADWLVKTHMKNKPTLE